MRDLRLDRPVASWCSGGASPSHTNPGMPRAPACLGQCAAWAVFRLARHLHSPQPRRPCRACCRRPRPSGARRNRPSPATRRGSPGGWVAGWTGGLQRNGAVALRSGALERRTLQLKTRQTMSISTASHMPRARWAAKAETRGAKAETRGARRRSIGGARTCAAEDDGARCDPRKGVLTRTGKRAKVGRKNQINYPRSS